MGDSYCGGVLCFRYLALAGGEVGDREVCAEACFGAAELGVVGGERCGEHADGFGVTESGEGVSAPTREVADVERDMGLARYELVAGWEEPFSIGEGA